MTEQERQARPHLRWLGIGGQFVWLAYLPLLFIPWFISAPTMPQLVGGLAGLTVFLGLYFTAIPTVGARRIVLATATLALAIALAFTHSNWTVIAIYAAAMVGELRPMRRAGAFLAAFAAGTAAAGFALRQHPFYWAFGVFFMIMVGAANISRAALEDKNRALLSAQDEVTQIAATAERERIGRDLHDLLGRTLTLIAIKADLAVKLSPRDAERAESEMREVAAAAREALAEVRSAVAGMTGASLAREISSAQSALRAAGIACVIEGDAEEIEHGAGAVLAMALREAITNVIRHSGAGACHIKLTQADSGLQLAVRDNGDGGALREGGGIGGVRARLAAAGGGLSVTSDAHGTQFVARMPLKASA